MMQRIVEMAQNAANQLHHVHLFINWEKYNTLFAFVLIQREFINDFITINHRFGHERWRFFSN